ncbi:TetR/AcrR family transcriptional regulator [Sphingobium sp.]|uniref:TetR/AcrR family transcriptional regulator n=1 Tax=Sphingobium sp. TaxID=1912891 RepID=UPI003B3A4A46
MRGRTPKVLATTWIDTARRVLIEDGIGGVKIDRLANRLGVSRGGFYHYFGDRDILLEKLLDHWEESCRFLPTQTLGTTPAAALAWLEGMTERLIEEDGYDHHFDMAVRDWARSDRRAEWAVERADRARMQQLERAFAVLGYGNDEAALRARIYYYHQIGYYAIGVRESITDRRRNAQLYHEILFGIAATKLVEDAAKG